MTSNRTQVVKEIINSLDKGIQKRLSMGTITKKDKKELWEKLGGEDRYQNQKRCFSCDLARYKEEYVSDKEDDEIVA